MEIGRCKVAIILVIGLMIISSICFAELMKPTIHNTILFQMEDFTQLLRERESAHGADVLLCFDLRDRESYRKGHIKDFINIPFEEQGKNLLSYLEKNARKKTPILLFCYSGKRSAQAFNLLSEKGYTNLHYVRFGYEEYITKLQDKSQIQTGKCKCEEEE